MKNEMINKLEYMEKEKVFNQLAPSLPSKSLKKNRMVVSIIELKIIRDKVVLRKLNDMLAQKLFYDPPATIKYWENGYYKTIECEINKFDSERNKLEVLENGEKIRISMDCIVEIE